MRIQTILPDHPQAIELIRELDLYQNNLYPAESNHLDDPETLSLGHVKFLGAWEDKTLAGIAAVKEMGDYGELKRMFVPHAHRGKGIAKQLIHALETHLAGQAIFRVCLETGIHQPEAIGLYRALGYEDCDPFGDYAPDPLSVFMEKHLSSTLPALMTVSPYAVEQEESVIELWTACGLTRPWNDPATDIRLKCMDNPEEFLLGWIGPRLVATCMAGYDGHRGWIYYFGVAPDYQGKGLGRALLSRAEEMLRLRGCAKINLMVRKDNAQAVRFYDNLGYCPDQVQVLGKRFSKED